MSDQTKIVLTPELLNSALAAHGEHDVYGGHFATLLQAFGSPVADQIVKHALVIAECYFDKKQFSLFGKPVEFDSTKSEVASEPKE